MKLIKLLLFILVIVVLTTGLFPLKYYYSYLAKQIRPIQLENIEGSLLKGSSEKLSIYGLNLGKADWVVYPSSYNEGTLDLTLSQAEYDINAKLIKKPKSEKIKNLTGTIDFAYLAKKLNFNRSQFSGYVKLDFDLIEFYKGAPKTIIGIATTKDLMLVRPLKKALGEIEVKFVPDSPQIIVGQVNSKSNVLNVSGAIYIHKNHRWEVKLTLTPSPGEYEVMQALQGIGSPRRGGGRNLNLAGFY